MKIGSMLLVVVLLFCGGIGSGSIEAYASSPAGVSELQVMWFLAGYVFDVADTSDEIIMLRLVLRDGASSEIKDQITSWSAGDLSKADMRLLLMEYLRTGEGLELLEIFRMAEWVSNVEDAVIDIKSAGENERLIFEAIADAHALTSQARGFIDVFTSTLPQEVLQALERISSAGSRIDIAGLITSVADVEGLVGAILGLTDDCRSIKSRFGLGD